jgi:hypothetical protein
MSASSSVSFREEQYFRTIWLWLVVGLVAGLQWWTFYKQVVRGEPWGDRPASNWVIVVSLLVFGIGLPVFFLFCRLVVSVTDVGVEIRFLPLVRRTIPFSQIVRVRTRTYSALREYGGWGIRWGTGGKRAYNVSGSEGVELTLTDGSKLMIGSQRAHQLEEAIAPYLRTE